MQIADPQHVRDTIAAVFRQREFDRTLRESLWNRFWTWVDSLLDQLGRTIASSRVLYWTVITLATLLAVAVVARVAWLYYVRGTLVAETGPGRRARSARARDPQRVAQELAAAGRYTEAAHALWAALLDAVTRRTPVRPHPSKTVGDYVRELRTRAPDLWPRFRDFARVYEVVVYGLGTCDRERWERLSALAAPLLTPGARGG